MNKLKYSIFQKGIAKRKTNAKFVKILGSGDISQALQVEVNFASASAAKKIEAAGGSVTLA